MSTVRLSSLNVNLQESDDEGHMSGVEGPEQPEQVEQRPEVDIEVDYDPSDFASVGEMLVSR